MKAFQPYVFFNGNCREAVEFYGKVFGIAPQIMTYDQAPPPPPDQKMEGCAPGTDMAASAKRVMHASLTSGSALLMASDVPVGQSFSMGAFTVNIDCESQEEQDKFFAGLSEGGKVVMPLGDSFWGARFGMLDDKFGVNWMLNFTPKK